MIYHSIFSGCPASAGHDRNLDAESPVIRRGKQVQHDRGGIFTALGIKKLILYY